MSALLEVRSLTVRYGAPGSEVCAVDGVHFSVAPGECVGIVGESGSGKTQLVLATLRLLPRSAHVAGEVSFAGIDLLRAPTQLLNTVRGQRVGTVFQDPMTSLTPHLTVGAHLREVLTVHRGLDRGAAERRARELLERVHLSDTAERLRQYPHQLSGGMRQRVLIALALACDPDLLIADEPTTALDVTVQAGILELLRELKNERRLGIVLITHDFGVAAALCDRVAVMYAGRIVEEASAGELFRAPRHPYSAGLLASLPRLDAPTDRDLVSIDGQPPAPGEARRACAFAPRCNRADQRCETEEPRLLGAANSAGSAACHHPLGDAR